MYSWLSVGFLKKKKIKLWDIFYKVFFLFFADMYIHLFAFKKWYVRLLFGAPVAHCVDVGVSLAVKHE